MGTDTNDMLVYKVEFHPRYADTAPQRFLHRQP